MAEGNAALPWAAQQTAGADTKPLQDTDAATTLAEEDLQPISIQQLGLELGARIEVCTMLKCATAVPRIVSDTTVVS